MLTPEQTVLAVIVLCVAGAGLTRVLARWREVSGWVAFGVTLVTAVAMGSAALRVVTVGAGHPAAFSLVPQVALVLRLHVDGLSALFVLLASAVAVPAALYSIAYLRHYPSYSVGRYYPYFLLFLAAMYGLVTTTDLMWFFCGFWQMMTLPGYALIRFDHQRQEHVRAAWKYLLLMQVACAATMIGAEVLVSGAGAASGGTHLKYDFDTLSASLPGFLRARPAAAAMAFGLFLVGFGIKMGMWPFGQLWLPDAHPAAPSPVSALLSGVMIKTGVYGLMRYFLWLVPVEARADYPLGNWGIVVVVLGTVTLFTGTVQALRQNQAKRLLAYSSIGQVGYILLGVGTAMTLLGTAKTGVESLAWAGMVGALLHTLNHGVFKSLLFLNAGSAIQAAKTQDLNQLGGLLRWLPWTGVTALIGSLAMAGVPLSSGFVSKWSLFVAGIQGGTAARLLPVCAAVAILTSALTLALFLKFFGAMFLGRTSAWVTAALGGDLRSLEGGWQMRGAQVLLAVGCLGMGLLPVAELGLVQSALGASRQGFGAVLAAVEPPPNGLWTGLSLVQAGAVYGPAVLAAVVGVLLIGIRWLAKSGGSHRRASAPWLCGYAQEAESNRYRAGAMYGEAQRGLDRIWRVSPARTEVVPDAALGKRAETWLRTTS